MTPKLYVGGVPAEEIAVVLLDKDCGYDHTIAKDAPSEPKLKKLKYGYKGASKKKMQKALDSRGLPEPVRRSPEGVQQTLEEVLAPKLEVLRVRRLEEGEEPLDVANMTLAQKVREIQRADRDAFRAEVELKKDAEPQTVKVELAPIVLTPNINVTLPAITVNVDLAKTTRKTQEMERSPDGLLTKVVTIEEPVAEAVPTA